MFPGMLRHHAYILRSLASATLLITFCLTSIVWLTQALRLIEVIVNQGVPLPIFLMLSVLSVPSLLLMILPISLFLATLFVYNRLKTESELVVLEAAGISLWQLARPAIMAALTVMLIGYFTAFYLMPICYGKFRDMQTYLRNQYVSVLLQEGVFSTPVDGLTVFVRERDSSGNLKGILVHDSRQPAMSVTMMAESGKLVRGSQGQRFLLENGNRQELRDGRLSLLNFDSYMLDLSFYAPEMGQRSTDPHEFFLSDLLDTEGLSEDEIAARRAEFHQRVQWPLYSLTFTFIALAALLAGEYSRRGQAKRIIVSVMVTAAVAFAAVGLRNLMADSVIYTVIAYLNVVAAPVASAYIITRPHRARKSDSGLSFAS